jgi:N-hydroxyarylamine O-acetyltransferase
VPFDLDAYCARIAYAGPRVPTLEVLRAVALHHPVAIAYENIAVAAGIVPDVALDAVVTKLVGTARGGYCYEQNTLLLAALVELGFAVTGLAARVRYRIPPDVSTPRSHMVLLVDLPDGPCIVDAGFGGLTLTAPVMLRYDEPQATPHEAVRLVARGGDYCLQAQLGEEWVDVYLFDLAPHIAADYVQQNWHTATRPNALFSNNLVAGRPAAGGRYVLFNRTLTYRPLGGAAQRRELASDAELRAVLRETFGLEIPQAEFDAAAQVASRGQALNPSFA